MIEVVDGFDFLKPGMCYYVPSRQTYVFGHHYNRSPRDLAEDAMVAFKGKDTRNDLFNRLIEDYHDPQKHWQLYERDLALSFFDDDFRYSVVFAHQLIGESQSFWFRFWREMSASTMIEHASILMRRASFDKKYILQIAKDIDLMPFAEDEINANLGYLGDRLQIALESESPRKAKKIWECHREYNLGVDGCDDVLCGRAKRRLVKLNAVPFFLE